MGNKLNQIEPIAQDAWGDVPNLGADFVAPDTCHGLHNRIAELENIQLYECPECCFRYDARHENETGGYSCPNCAEARLESERNAAQARSGAKSIALEELRAQLDACATRETRQAELIRDVWQLVDPDSDMDGDLVAALKEQLDAAQAAKAQAEADARRFAELVDGGNFSLELQQRIDKYLEAK